MPQISTDDEPLAIDDVALKIDGNEVSIIVSFAKPETAGRVYDGLCQACAAGNLSLTLTGLRPRVLS